MPKSRSKRSTYIPPKPPRPKPSPRWVPALGLGLIGVGTLILILIYLIPGIPGGNINLIIGFVMMAAGLVTLSRWR
ncbi:MAG TPA: cell division protein CrgA [Euzebyales bacterium]